MLAISSISEPASLLEVLDSVCLRPRRSSALSGDLRGSLISKGFSESFSICRVGFQMGAWASVCQGKIKHTCVSLPILLCHHHSTFSFEAVDFAQMCNPVNGIDITHRLFVRHA